MSPHGPERTDDHAAPTLEQRAWQAELERVRAEVRATERRQRRRVFLVAGGALVAVLLLGTFGTTAAMIQAERARQEAAALRQLAEAARDAKEQARAEAVAQRDRAAAVFDRTRQVLDEMTSKATGDAPEDELAKSSTWTAQQWYDMARVYSLASAQRERYAARAVELLRRAVAKGYNDADHMAQDADLEPLRQHEDFKKLLADLRAKAPKPDK